MRFLSEKWKKKKERGKKERGGEFWSSEREGERERGGA